MKDFQFYNLLFYILFILPISALTISNELLKNFKRCKVYNDSCLNDAIQDAINQLTRQDFPKLNIPKLDPIEVPEITFGSNGSVVNVRQKYTDIKLNGFKDATVSKSHVDLDKKTITFSLFLPKLWQVSNYDITGRILIIPVFGKGEAVLSLVNATVIHKIDFEESRQNNNVFIKVKSYTFTTIPQSITFQLDNLFNGNKELSDRVHEVLNENWQYVWEDTRQGFEEAYGQVLGNFAKRVFSKIPANDIFMEYPV